MRGALHRLGVALGAGLLVTGVVVAALGYAASAGPATVVRGYFAALADGDAAAALAYGPVPAGPRTLLTAAVLREQQRIAPIRDVAVTSTVQRRGRATVAMRYTLAFPADDVPVSTQVALHETPSGWRLDRVAVATELLPGTAAQRESVLGGQLPVGTVVIFPGALPVTFDTPYLELDPVRDSVDFETPSSTPVSVQVSPAGRAAVLAAVRSGVSRCVSGPADPACPLPDERYVPGSVHGRLDGGLQGADVVLEPGPLGTLAFRGSATVTASWRRLDFTNQLHSGRGRLHLRVRALAYAVAPLRLRWVAS